MPLSKEQTKKLAIALNALRNAEDDLDKAYHEKDALIEKIERLEKKTREHREIFDSLFMDTKIQIQIKEI